MAVGKWKVYEVSKKYLLDGTLDLDDTTNWKCALFTSSSNANTLTLATPTYGNLTNELGNGSGYTTAGAAVAGQTLTNSSGTITHDLNDISFTASGSLVFRYAVVYKDATTNSVVKPLLMVCLLDTTPGDITISTGVTFTITINASGAFTLSGGATD